jgi:hypothetical protein
MGDRAGRWFHTLVVVGAAMTACGGNTVVDAPREPDAGRAGAQPVVGGTDGGSADGGAASKPDAAATQDAAPAPDASAMYAFCCAGPYQCRLDDAGAPVCAVSCPTYCCLAFNHCIQ